jgi:outer membrane protein assembly factor BamB
VNWSQFHFDPCHTGYNSYEKILSPATVANLVVDWQYNIPSNLDMYSSPAVVNGMVYVGAVPGVYALDANTGALVWTYSSCGCGWPELNTVYALSAADGVVVWQQTLPGRVLSSPAIANGIVYAASQDYGLYAFDANTGNRLWNAPDNGASPVVANGVVYTGSFSDNSVHAYNASTGAPLWKYKTGKYVYSTPSVVNGKLYIRSDDGNVYAFHLPN